LLFSRNFFCEKLLPKSTAYKKAADKYQRLNAPLVHPSNTFWCGTPKSSVVAFGLFWFIPYIFLLL